MRIMSAGWRMAYIGKASDGACIFCSTARSKADRQNMVIWRGGRAFVMMNRYPYSTGHLMVAPYRHVGHLSGLEPDEAREVMDLVRLCESLLTEALRPDGLNVGVNIGRCAGAGYPGHVHVHVVPRWEGDTNFMPVVSETKVLPETLIDTYEKIMRAGKALSWAVPEGSGTPEGSGKHLGTPKRRPGRKPDAGKKARGRRG
jgi:ATP adenylyltransferase